MKIGAAFPSTYLKASDLQGRTVTVTMDRVIMEEVGGEHKPVLYFQGTERGIVLNKTNSSIIAEMHGDETDDWVGKKIKLYPARVEFQGKIVDAIRIKLDTSAPAEVVQSPLAAKPNGTPKPARQIPIETDDEIPF